MTSRFFDPRPQSGAPPIEKPGSFIDAVQQIRGDRRLEASVFVTLPVDRQGMSEPALPFAFMSGPPVHQELGPSYSLDRARRLRVR
jgi:hypothetical protein